MRAVLAGWAVLALVHEILARMLVESSVVSSMLSAGAHTPLYFVALAAAFYALRLAVYVLAPTLAVGWLAYAIASGATPLGWLRSR